MPKDADINIPLGPDLTQQDTQDIPPITEEMLENFSEKKKEDPEVVEVDFSEKPKKPKKNRRKISFWKLLVVIVVIVLIGFLTYLTWNRWFRYNDQESFVGNWQVAKSDHQVSISENKIKLQDNAVLEYSIDPFTKIIHYKTGKMEGDSHYRFSADRTQIAFIEKEHCNFFSSLMEDIRWAWDVSVCAMNGIELSPAYTKNNSNDVNTENTGIEEIMANGSSKTILLDKVSSKK